MAYYNIRYNGKGEPYIVEKNFGSDPKEGKSSSHWTWHITPRGVRYLCRGPFGKTQAMPTFIDKEQLENLKAYNMLRRADGTLIGGVNPLYPSDSTAKPDKPPVQPTRPQQPLRPQKPTRPQPPVRPQQPLRPQQSLRPTAADEKPHKPHKPFPYEPMIGKPRPSKRRTTPKERPLPPPPPPPTPQPVQEKRGLWGWLKSLFGRE